MATLVLSAVGAQLGVSLGGGVLGLSSAVIGRAVGATIGQVIDQKVLGTGSDPVERGKVERFRLNGASEGAGIAQVYGRMRVSGQVIWSSRFLEKVTSESVGGKGAGGGGQTVHNYSYSVSLAIALCEGVVARVGRIWADGTEISPTDHTIRIYHGDEKQLPDPKIEAIEGVGNAPAYRGTAYVVFEDLELGAFGNRVPQFSFEVVRLAPEDHTQNLAAHVRATALVPGTGEYSLATTPVYRRVNGASEAVNVNSPLGVPDLTASAEAMRAELPHHNATSLVVSWFGTDLRCGECEIKPLVESHGSDAQGMPWQVSGVTRANADLVPYIDERPAYGGTPTDQSVKQAIAELRDGGREVMFYPFILMTQLEENGLEDPWTGADDQPPLPWRGRITASIAPGQAGSPDGTSVVDDEVAAFFGQAQPGHFPASGASRGYSGPAEFSYRRFILHNAWLCADAGGVDAFCIGSELRGLTQLRGASGFPVVEALRTLAADVRSILGPETKISYAADWSEYFGYQPKDGSGDVFFHLDPLWADANIDFVGIDNYMPLADWRDGDDHADAAHGATYDLAYLSGNVAGGEGYDWFYADETARDDQVRTPIADTAHGEDWVFRVKDLVGWWSNAHHDRPGGVRSATPTAWVPGSKPIWFTEVGCPAVDKGANAPNLFFDPKSSESAVPPYSTGRRDDFMQVQALRATLTYWDEAANNPVSAVYNGPMVDLDHAFVWAWDARPFPWFPNDGDTWTDGANYTRGHWLNGRASARALSSVVAEVCERAGVAAWDTSGLYGVVRGYKPDVSSTGRAALQPLMLAYGFDAAEVDGVLVFRMRSGTAGAAVGEADYVDAKELGTGIERTRASDAETVGRVRVISVEEAGDYDVRASQAMFPDETVETVTDVDLPLVLTAPEARAIAARWLVEARAAKDAAKIALPPSRRDVKAGTVIEVEDGGHAARYRVDRVEEAGARVLEAQRIEPEAYVAPPDEEDETTLWTSYVAAAPLEVAFLDLPLLTGDEVEHAPHLAVYGSPWPGSAAAYKSPDGNGFLLSGLLDAPAVMGETLTDLLAAAPGLYDRGPAVQVKIYGGALASVTEVALLSGANAAAIGDGETWEVFQFREAELVGDNTYDLTLRLRGQAGTDGVMPDVWPAGSRFVLLSVGLAQPDFAASERGLSRVWRVGPSTKPVDDDVYVEETRTFEGVGLRPYAPVHFKVDDDTGDHVVTWVRRTRVDGDSWAGLDVPLGEAVEAYLVRVVDGGSVMREETVTAPSWTYAATDRAADGVTGAFTVEVAQISDRFGPGAYGKVDIDE
ncbi:MAG: glycoside hydrolase/phage tail family protein [Pseudomonadota bacterium]